MVKVSVVLPVYNIEKYLKQCLESIVNQTLRDIEIICINDGSTDRSLNILEDFAERDSRIKILTQKNQGAGACRNRGIKLACGKYVYFMDGDDYLNPDSLRQTYEICEEKSLDFLMFKISNFYEDTNEIIDDDYYNMPYLKNRVGDNTFNYNDVRDMALDLCVCPPGNLFKRQLILDIEFPEGLLYEDNVFFTHALFKADRIFFYDEFLYNRRKRSDSTTTPVTVKTLDTLEISNMMIDLCVEFNHENHKRELYYRIFFNIYRTFKNADASQKPEFFEKIKKEYLKNKDKWESDEYFAKNLKPYYKHMFMCGLNSNDCKEFEKCVDSYGDSGFKRKFKKLRKKIL